MKTILTILLFALPFIGQSQECYSRCLVAKFKVYQTNTNAPVVESYFNPNGYTFTTARDGVGIYRVLGFTGQEFTNSTFMYEMEVNATSLNGGNSVDIYPASNTSITLRTYDATGTPTDNVISPTTGLVTNWHIVTIWRYKN